jgi:hypothetical protein
LSVTLISEVREIKQMETGDIMERRGEIVTGGYNQEFMESLHHGTKAMMIQPDFDR